MEVTITIGDTRPGVYIITCLVTGECYVGGSGNVTRRFQQHRYDLRHGLHKSKRLQAAWDTYGEASFSFGYAIKCAADQILVFEQRYLDALQPAFNTEKLAGASLGTTRDEDQRKRLKLRPQSIAKRYPFDGEMLTVPEIAERTGLSVPGVRARMRRGVPVGEPRHQGNPLTVEVEGEILTLKQVAKKYDLPLTTIHSRVRYGWTGEELTKPQIHRGGRPSTAAVK